jgi:DNA-binding GntR family transcriptional regulator
MTDGLQGLYGLRERQSLADLAYQRLIRAIMRNDLSPGTPLSVPELARRLNVSRSPVREAVQRLIYDGLAEHVPHRGAVVVSIDEQSFRDLLDVRHRLEGLAARLAAERIRRSELDALAETLAEHESVVAGEDVYRNVEHDMRFHELIRAAAANADLDKMLARTQSRAHLSLHRLWRGSRDPKAMLAEHRAVFDAIAAGDADAAEWAAERHIVGLRQRVEGAAAEQRAMGVGE